MQFPELETSRLILNQLSEGDGIDLLEIFSDENVVKYYDIDVYESQEQSLELIEFFYNRFTENAGIRWAISPNLMLEINFNDINQNTEAEYTNREVKVMYSESF